MNLLVAVLTGYLVGSFPTAYLVVRRKAGVDIRVQGSGNVGGYNTARVTGSAMMGWVVGLTDGLKGLAVSAASWAIVPDDPSVQFLAILGVVLGHNYPVWLKFKGGRGLATVAGALFGLGVAYTALWTLSWVGFHRWRKDITEANVISTFFAAAAVWLIPAGVVDGLSIRSIDPESYALFVTTLSVLLLISHAEVFPKWFARLRTTENRHAE